MEETAFYVLGLVLVGVAVVVSVVGLRVERFPTSRVMLAAGVGLIALLVAATTTSAVILAREEQRHRNEEAAAEEQDVATAAEAAGESPKQLDQSSEDGGAAAATAAIDLAAAEDGTLAYDAQELETESGEVTIEFNNPAAIEHDVAIEQDGKEIAKSDLVSDGTTSLTVDLEPGEYVFYCTVPGHREGGMEGALTVK